MYLKAGDRARSTISGEHVTVLLVPDGRTLAVRYDDEYQVRIRPARIFRKVYPEAKRAFKQHIAGVRQNEVLKRLDD